MTDQRTGIEAPEDEREPLDGTGPADDPAELTDERATATGATVAEPEAPTATDEPATATDEPATATDEPAAELAASIATDELAGA
ncbi:MAG TPA: hypothetical protein VN773_02700, partial [Verrucomicrobiae bacterium]|nr:hypothetical protein [Verrucomicrobiae bacterium]